MKFNLTSPCAHCPFRSDVPGYLRAERARHLARLFARDDRAWFACHETSTAKGRSTRHRQTSHCAGLMILQHKTGQPNIAMRIACATGQLKPEQLNLKAPVFATLQQFARHHAKAEKKGETSAEEAISVTALVRGDYNIDTPDFEIWAGDKQLA